MSGLLELGVALLLVGRWIYLERRLGRLELGLDHLGNAAEALLDASRLDRVRVDTLERYTLDLVELAAVATDDLETLEAVRAHRRARAGGEG